MSLVILNILCQRILVSRVDRSWPIEGGDIDLMHILGSGGGQRAKKSTVEALLQRENGIIGRARCHVIHAGAELFRSGLYEDTTTLLGCVVHHGDLEGTLICASTTHGCSDAIHTWRSHIHEGLLVDLPLLLHWVDTNASSSGYSGLQQVSLGKLKKLGVIVADSISTDRGKHI